MDQESTQSLKGETLTPRLARQSRPLGHMGAMSFSPTDFSTAPCFLSFLYVLFQSLVNLMASP